MVYYRFVRGYGPYAYTSTRMGKRVVSVYLGAVSSKVAGISPEKAKHRPGEHVIKSKEELQAIEERALVTLQLEHQGVAIIGGPKAYQEMVKSAYTLGELAELGIKNINIVSDEGDWEIIIVHKLPTWKKQELEDLGLSYQDVHGMLDTQGNLFLLGTVDKDRFMQNFHHEVGQAKYRQLSYAKKLYFNREVAPNFEYDYIFDPTGDFPGDNDRYALLYDAYKTLGEEKFLRKFYLTLNDLESMEFR